jgi:hypothetical protein
MCPTSFAGSNPVCQRQNRDHGEANPSQPPRTLRLQHPLPFPTNFSNLTRSLKKCVRFSELLCYNGIGTIHAVPGGVSTCTHREASPGPGPPPTGREGRASAWMPGRQAEASCPCRRGLRARPAIDSGCSLQPTGGKDLCFRQKKITSFLPKQRSPPSRRRVRSPPACGPDGPLFSPKDHLISDETNILRPPARKPGLSSSGATRTPFRPSRPPRPRRPPRRGRPPAAPAARDSIRAG